MKGNKILFFFGAISIAIFFFYLRYINLSTDTIILFLSSKLFYGEWLRRGIFPLFNPHIFNGVPYAFDPGMNNFHPLSLLFLLPYPLSFAAWVGITSFMFLLGFYLIFRKFSQTNVFTTILTLILFFSGGGLFLRLNNPMIWSVIAHYGLFGYSLLYLNKPVKYSWLFPLITGIFMTISGHIQFVVYGYLFGFLLSIIYYRTSIKKVFVYFVLLAFSTGWYFVFSIPIIWESTRLTLNNSNVETGSIYPLQLLQLLFPMIWGAMMNGSKWGVGLTNVAVSSVSMWLGLAFVLFNNKIKLKEILPLFVLFIFAFGLIPLPFFRGPGQIFILIFIFTLLILAKEEKTITSINLRGIRYVIVLLLIILGIGFVFFLSPLFPFLFSSAYKIVKHGSESLFFDLKTIQAIGFLISMSLLPLTTILALLLSKHKYSRYFMYVLMCFVCVEGIYLNFFHNMFVPVDLIKAQISKEPQPILANNNYRLETASDVVPFVGFFNYMGNVHFRPPFSKEPPLITTEELKSYKTLRSIFSFVPSSWVMTGNLNTIQGYSTFVPAKIAHYFDNPSNDYKTEYKYILDRNSLFAQSEKGSHINSIETSRITLNDPRWQALGVRYFISDRPLAKYKLIASDSGRLFYENPETLPIYRVEKEGKVTGLTPVYADPNRWEFDISEDQVGGMFTMVMNPGGFVAKLDGREIPLTKHDLTMEAQLVVSGRLVVSYSPMRHLIETLKQLPHIL